MLYAFLFDFKAIFDFVYFQFVFEWNTYDFSICGIEADFDQIFISSLECYEILGSSHDFSLFDIDNNNSHLRCSACNG